jgi:HSP20 family protein
MRSLVLKPSRIDREMNRLMNSFFGSPVCESGCDHDFMPRVNVRENDDKVSLTFEVPGLDKGDIKIVVEDDILTVSGERKFSDEKSENDFVRSEIRSGSFSRSFTLPDTVDAEKVTADYKNGLLEVTLPKKEEKKPKQIEVKVS